MHFTQSIVYIHFTKRTSLKSLFKEEDPSRKWNQDCNSITGQWLSAHFPLTIKVKCISLMCVCMHFKSAPRYLQAETIQYWATILLFLLNSLNSCETRIPINAELQLKTFLQTFQCKSTISQEFTEIICSYTLINNKSFIHGVTILLVYTCIADNRRITTLLQSKRYHLNLQAQCKIDDIQ